MTTKESLKEIRYLDMELQSIKEQINRLEYEAQGLQAMKLSDMPRGGKGLDMADVMAEAIDLQQKYAVRWIELNQKRKDVEANIDSVEMPEERAVLRYRYLANKSWSNIAVLLGYEERTVYRIHGRALLSYEQVVSKCQ